MAFVVFHVVDPTTFLLSSSKHGKGRAVTGWLLTVAMAQRDFKAYDRDGNGNKDYWRGDIAGLSEIKNKEGVGVKLIDLSVALADDRPVVDMSHLSDHRRPLQGYWFRAVRFADEKTIDPNRFAISCFPDKYSPETKWTYIISQDEILYKKDLGHGKGIETYPMNPEKEGWIERR